MLDRVVMKLRRVEIENFRGFRRASFDFMEPGSEKPLDAVVLIGPAGSGKSSLLGAVAGFFGGLAGPLGHGLIFEPPSSYQAFESDDLFGAEPLQVADIRQGGDQARVSIAWLDDVDEPGAGRHRKFECDANVLTEEASLPKEEKVIIASVEKRPWTAHTGLVYSTDISGADNLVRELGLWRSRVRDASPRPTGLIVSFDAYRQPLKSGVPGPNRALVNKHRCWRALAPTERRFGELENRYGQLKQWIVNLDHLRLKQPQYRLQWDILVDALNTLLSPYEFAEVDENFDIFFRTPSGTVRLDALSDSFRSIFAITADLLLRLSLSTSQRGQVLNQEATCLIDEIDVHLDPSFEEGLLPGLRGLFPNVQFIVTTYSDRVMKSVEPHQVFVLPEVN